MMPFRGRRMAPMSIAGSYRMHKGFTNLIRQPQYSKSRKGSKVLCWGPAKCPKYGEVTLL